jgi:hypothetical protein
MLECVKQLRDEVDSLDDLLLSSLAEHERGRQDGICLTTFASFLGTINTTLRVNEQSRRRCFYCVIHIIGPSSMGVLGDLSLSPCWINSYGRHVFSKDGMIENRLCDINAPLGDGTLRQHSSHDWYTLSLLSLYYLYEGRTRGYYSRLRILTKMGNNGLPVSLSTQTQTSLSTWSSCDLRRPELQLSLMKATSDRKTQSRAQFGTNL